MDAKTPTAFLTLEHILDAGADVVPYGDHRNVILATENYLSTYEQNEELEMRLFLARLMELSPMEYTALIVLYRVVWEDEQSDRVQTLADMLMVILTESSVTDAMMLRALFTAADVTWEITSESMSVWGEDLIKSDCVVIEAFTELPIPIYVYGLKECHIRH